AGEQPDRGYTDIFGQSDEPSGIETSGERTQRLYSILSWQPQNIVDPEVKRQHAFRHGSIGSPLSCYFWEFDRDVSSFEILILLYYIYMLHYVGRGLFALTCTDTKKIYFIQKYCKERLGRHSEIISIQSDSDYPGQAEDCMMSPRIMTLFFFMRVLEIKNKSNDRDKSRYLVVGLFC
ncbi:unnamed protein product, partial [Urochloa humidicola]